MIVCVLMLIIGAVLLGLYWQGHSSSDQLVTRIKNRMPPIEAIQEDAM